MSGCSDGLVRVFDTRTGQCIKYAPNYKDHTVCLGNPCLLLVSSSSDTKVENVTACKNMYRTRCEIQVIRFSRTRLGSQDMS